MVFSSYPFILVFLPAVLLLAALLARAPSGWLITGLAVASLAFYGYWNWRFLWVIGLSITVNYALGRLLARERNGHATLVLGAGIAFNLALLGYFKYVNFFIDNLHALTGADLSYLDVALPLGISFFTFQQIAYLVDARQGQVVQHSFHHYLLFVSFFPHLIAGPLLNHREIMPQVVSGQVGRIKPELFARGVAIFVLGVAKKVLIADGVARYATPVFEASANGVPVPLIEAWGGTLAYTFQIYFDFSAYSDMAIGLGLMLGLRLPVNFNSPYKATSLIDFWRRWHITLSRFLLDYLYIPLGGNRLGAWRRYGNVLIVMLLGGLWHGAAWTFVAWGALHGCGLAANHWWNKLRPERRAVTSGMGSWTARLLTFLFVAVAWVLFRCDGINSAGNMLAGMAALNGVVLPESYLGHLGPLGPTLAELGVRFEPVYLFLGVKQVLVLFALLGLVMLAPNTLEIAGYGRGPVDEGSLARPRDRELWRPTATWGLGLSALAIVSLVMMSDAGEFLYFQF